jgi:hypothetical protein
MNDARLAATQTRMAQTGVDLAVYGCGPGYQYLTGIENNCRCGTDLVSASELVVVPSETGGVARARRRVHYGRSCSRCTGP